MFEEWVFRLWGFFGTLAYGPVVTEVLLGQKNDVFAFGLVSVWVLSCIRV